MIPPLAHSNLHGWRLFAWLALAVLMISALSVVAQPLWVDGLRSAIRATARTSFALFLLAFLASSLATLVPGATTRGVLRERRFLGLAFAFSHLVHGVLIVAYANLYPDTFWSGRTALANIPGSIGYLFILAMAATSFPGAIKAMGARAWRLLHSTGSWVIAAIFCLSFFKRIPMGTWYVLGFSLMFAAIVLKFTATLVRPALRGAVR